ncbi:MAG: hypothetical protein KTR31_32625 [Myxococcales bacterium]|nr:hypothetical protein [Myxococcales bacterium]
MSAMLLACLVACPTPESTTRSSETTPVCSADTSVEVQPTETADTAVEASCDPTTGFPPLTPCSGSDPCTNGEGETVTATSDVPRCRTTRVDDHPWFSDAPARSRTDGAGHTRFACVYEPPAATVARPVPLVVFLHGGSGVADDVYDATLLRDKAVDWPLAGETGPAGFVLVSLQSRNVHYPWAGLHDGRHHDSLHWDVANNTDLVNIDAWIDELAATGRVDTERIYVIGWSEGMMTSTLYGIERWERPTPGGHRVAAFGGYSGSSPFDREMTGGERCQREPLPTSAGAPMFGMSRTCDTVPCDVAQREALDAAGGTFGDTIDAETWRTQLTQQIGVQLQWDLLDDQGTVVKSCAETCGLWAAVRNHLVWPDGVRDPGGVDQEPAMLSFLRSHARDDG